MFGPLMTAMVTPFDEYGKVNFDEAQRLAAYLVDEQANDALIINGTTGESPTTSDEEKAELISVVKAEIGDRAKVLAGVGTFDTRHTYELAKDAEEAGADGLLIVTPYYSKPPQAALVNHFTTLAKAVDLPIMLYDIPGRAGVALSTNTLITLGQLPNIIGVKDAKCNAIEAAKVMAESDLIFWAGDDAYLLPLLAVGGFGVVGTSTHFTGVKTKQLISAFKAGDHSLALDLYRELLPVYTGVFATQGCMLVKAGLQARGLNPGGLRAPLQPATEAEAAAFLEILSAAGF